jgi:hypothetical protein
MIERESTFTTILFAQHSSCFVFFLFSDADDLHFCPPLPLFDWTYSIFAKKLTFTPRWENVGGSRWSSTQVKTTEARAFLPGSGKHRREEKRR